MAFLSDKITKIGLSSDLSLFTVPHNQVAVEKNIFRGIPTSVSIQHG